MLSLVLIFSIFFYSPEPADAGTLLADDFTGTTIDTTKWVEYENGTVSNDGLSGRVRQNNALTVVGYNYWNNSGLKSVDTFDRSAGDITIETDMTFSDCNRISGGIMHGNWAVNSFV